MAVASFEALCHGVCEVAGVALPALQADETGTRAFTANLRDVAVTLLQVPSRPDAAFLLAELGTMPQACALEGWRALMEANLELIIRHGPVFGRNPETGEVILHRCCPLAETTPADVYQHAVNMATAAQGWRRTHFIKAPRELAAVDDPDAQVLRRPDANDVTAAAFERLCRALCEAAAISFEDSPFNEYAGIRSFAVRIGDAPATLVQRFETDPGSVHFVVGIGTPGPDEELPALEELMSANFELMTAPRGVRFGRHLLSGELMLQCVHLLGELSGSDALNVIASMSQFHAVRVGILAREGDDADPHAALSSASNFA